MVCVEKLALVSRLSRLCCSHFAAANGVRYRALAQQASPDCRGKLIRECGHIVVDVPSLVGAVSQLGLRRGGRAQGQPRHSRQHVLAA